MKRAPLKRKTSLRDSTEKKNRERIKNGDPLPGLKRSRLNTRSKKQKRTFREIDEKYLDYIRNQQCAIGCGYTKSDPHHLVHVGNGGSDYTAVPLCRKHHTIIHTTGLMAFEAMFSIDLWKCNAKHLDNYGRKIGKEITSRRDERSSRYGRKNRTL